MKKQKLWSGRFKEKTHGLAEEFNASISFDARLFRHDISGSVAHTRTLQKAKLLSNKEAGRIIKGLERIEREIASDKFRFTADMEDIHMAVEARLAEIIGPLAGKLHTARSRNDQVALDIRLYLRDELCGVIALLHGLKQALVEIAGENIGCIMPGYTHLQRAQPVLLSHHLLAYYEMLKRDTGRFLDCQDRLDAMPLGSGALAGSPYKLDRAYTAGLLGFSRVTDNSIDAVSDRDFIVEFLSSSSILMMHISRLSEELVLWSSQEFGFVELSDAFATGSSIMPQKKTPDIAELARAKTGRVYGSLVTLLTVMKGLPLSYNKDMQEDKEPLFDAVDTVKETLKVFVPMLKTLAFKKDAMLRAAKEGFLNATDAADYLVKKGLPFRQAHVAVGKAVAYCVKNKKTLEELDLREWRVFSPLFGPDVKKAVSIERSVNARAVYGGTALKTVKDRLKAVRLELKKCVC